MGKSISLGKQADLLAKVTGGKNVPPAALPNEQLISTEETQVTGNIEEIIAAEKKRLGVDVEVTEQKFIPPIPVAIDSLPQDKANDLAKNISTFTNSMSENAAPASDAPSETGAVITPTFCPRCAWDLTLPNGPQPDYEDKLKFITAMLANKPFQKSYSLLNNSLYVTFRTLRPKEIDACYEQIIYDIKIEKIKFQGDIVEMVNRYRLYLQLVDLKTKTIGGFDHDFPEGFTPKTNKKAATFWELPANLEEGSCGLDVIEEYMLNEVFETESLHRTIAATGRDFNRLVAQLEAMVDNENFWKPTETPS